jgi:hypothetical protein
MLLKRRELERIQRGEVTLVFRRWKKPTVKTGGTLKTALGVLAIKQVKLIQRAQIKRVDAEQAGYDSLADLLAELDVRDGDYYRIEVRFAGADPRIALRENDLLSQVELAEIQTRLARLDKASKLGPWTERVLRAIERHPKLPAGDLAARLRFEKMWLKTNIRKLKNLGLTISHQPGYEISPRGLAVLESFPR